MGFFQRLFGGGSGQSKSKKSFYTFSVKCKRCGEVIEGRVDLDNDLSVEYESGGDMYYCRKVLMGDGKNLCYQQIEVGLKFDSQRQVVEKRVESGGDFAE